MCKVKCINCKESEYCGIYNEIRTSFVDTVIWEIFINKERNCLRFTDEQYDELNLLDYATEIGDAWDEAVEESMVPNPNNVSWVD